jgi:antitoxin component of MazEF toxin-antitoxin module
MTEQIKFLRTVRRSGGTLAVTIPPELQRAIGMKEGQPVEIYLSADKKIIIQLKEKK